MRTIFLLLALALLSSSVAHGQGSGAVEVIISGPAYRAMVSAAIGRHMPTTTTLGAGEARCRFSIDANGRFDRISCSGSSPAHAELLRSAISATSAPPPPGDAWSSSQSVIFH